MLGFNRHRRLPRDIRRALRHLRRRIRAYVWWEGVAAVIVLAGALFWIGLAVDWTFEPTPAARRVAWYCVGALALGVFYWYVVRRIFVRMRPSSLALLLERRFPELGDRLLTSVELKRQPAEYYDESMLQKAEQEAAERIRRIDVVDVIDARPLNRKVLLAAALVASVAAFGFFSRDAFAFYWSRMQLSPELWPRQVELEVEGFQQDKREIIARDAEFELVVHAALVRGHQAPDTVEIRYRYENGTRGRDTMVRVGEAIAGRDMRQTYTYLFKNVVQNIEFDVVGGDDRIETLMLHVVDRPRVVEPVIDCEYPAYTGKPPEQRPASSPLRLPVGSELVLRGRSNKTLVAARLVDVDASSDSLEPVVIAEDAMQFSFELGTLMEDRLLLLTLVDADGIESAPPVRISIGAIADEPPEVAVRLHGIGTAITSEARIPFTGVVEDARYGSREVWFEYAAGQTLGRAMLDSQPNGSPEFQVDEAFDLRSVDAESNVRRLALKPGDQLALRLQALDDYDLSPEPHVGSSQLFELDIVTPEQLRGTLEQRELSLRQRFQAIFDKMRGTRSLLDRIEFGGTGTDAEDDASNPEDSDQDDAERARTRRRLRVAGANLNVAQSIQETLGVAEGFDEIQQELINNRIDTEELLDRLRDRVAEPLRHIADVSMPAVADRLESLQERLADEPTAREKLALAKVETDKVLAEMQAVLDKMLELEDYNEVLELLRGIIQDQQDLNDKTKDKQRSGLRDLLN